MITALITVEAAISAFFAARYSESRRPHDLGLAVFGALITISMVAR